MHHLPLSSRLLFTFTALFLPIGSHLADYSRTHIFNPKWTPHAKFHTGQTLAFSIVLGVLTIFFAWSQSSDLRLSLIASASCASLYWVCQTLAIVYPGTSYFDPDTEAAYLVGIPAQAWFGLFVFVMVGIACWKAL